MQSFKSFISEEIKNPPYNIFKFFKTKASQLSVVKSKFKSITFNQNIINDLRGMEKDDFEYLQELLSDNYTYSIIRTLKELIILLNDCSNDFTFSKYLNTHLENIDYSLNKFKQPLEYIFSDNGIIEKLKYDIETGYSEIPKNEFDEFVKNLKIFNPTISLLNKILSDLKSKLATFNTFNSYSFKHPEHENEEWLFHVTAFGKDILKNGFQETIPTDRKGLGFYGNNYYTSFTHDLIIAKSIFKSLKDVVNIIHEKLTAEDILKKAKEENLNYDEFLENVKRENHYPINSIKDVLYIYNYYLWHTKSRINPVFTNIEDLADKLKNQNIDDIMILKVKVKMEEFEYHKAEREFRILPKNILKVEKLA